MAAHAEVVTKRISNFLSLDCKLTCWSQDQCLATGLAKIHLSKSTYHESCCLPRSGLCLTYGVPSFKHWYNSSLLDGTWLLKAVGVNATEEAFRKAHVIEGVNHWILIGSHNGDALRVARHCR